MITIILINEDLKESKLIGKNLALPFLESNGEYAGRPADSAIAIEELERMCREGSQFLCFGLRSHWWFDYYSEFYNYVCSNFNCIFENEWVIIFDLRQKIN